MKYNSLGRTGIKVSEICLGTMTWGSQNSEAQAHAQMDHALEQGVNFFDTAELYPTTPASAETYGHTEEFIGTWFAKSGKRHDIVLASKVAGPGRAYIRHGRKMDPAGIREALDASLKRLKTDYIDLYQVHWPNRRHFHFRNCWTYDASQNDLAETVSDIQITLETLNEAVKAGKIRAIGLSNETTWGTQKYLTLAHAHDLPRVASIQNEYNLLYRHHDLDMAELSHFEDVGLLAYSPLAAGLLTGKYLDGQVPAGSRASLIPDLGGRMQPLQEKPVAAYVETARRHGLDPAAMALAFCLTRPFMTSVIIGARTMDQLSTAIGAKDITLSQDVLTEIADIHRQYPMPI